MIEQWRPVVGAEDWYDVSNQGRVRSWVPIGARSNNRARTEEPRLLKARPESRGQYLTVDLKAVFSLPQRVHRLVGEAFLGPLPDGRQTRHLNGDCRDNRLSNLRYGTPLENATDAIAHGTHRSLQMQARTHCAKGHDLRLSDSFYLISGVRSCRRCNIAGSSAWQKRDLARREARGEITPHLIREWAQALGLIPPGATGRLGNDIKWLFAHIGPSGGWTPTPDPRSQGFKPSTLADLIARHPEWQSAIHTRRRRTAA